MQDISQIIKQAREQQQGQIILDAIPYAKNIGLQSTTVDGQLMFKLPAKDSNEGNPLIPAQHGGVTGGAMELAAAVYVLLHIKGSQIPKVVDFSIDYLRPAMMENTYISCDMVRQGRRIANVHIIAWQTQKNKPVATARTHFIMQEDS